MTTRCLAFLLHLAHVSKQDLCVFCPGVAVLLLLVALQTGTASPTPAAAAAVASPDVEPPCGSCALAQVKNSSSSSSSSSSSGQTDMVEAVKRHILNMLHLSARPNVTQPVPRAALLNAIKKLQVGRVAEDGSVQIQEEGGRPGETDGGPPDPPAEIITFAEPGDVPSMVTFDISKEGSSPSVVEQANIWIFLKLAQGNRAKGKVTLRLLQRPQQGASGTADPKRDTKEVTISEKVLDTRRSGWHTLPVPHAVQAMLDAGDSVLHLRVSCPLCAEAGATPLLAPADGEHTGKREQSHRPFLMVVLREADAPSHRRDKRGLECDGTTSLCCKRQFYVNFKDIGWNDWIIAPPGYHANYCEGDCPRHATSATGSSLSFHSTVISHYRMRGYSPFQNIKSCCVPTRLRAMSMLYYNEEQKIIKKDIQNMIVDECGCS